MASAAFSKPEEAVWKNVKVRLVDFLAKQEGFTNNLDSQGSAFAIVSPYGDGGQILAAIAPQISQLIGGIVVFATCCDSDFDLIEVYRNGELVEKCYIGACFEEFMEFGEYSKPNMEFWKNLAFESQLEFRRFGTEGKCIEARELIIALPEVYTTYDPQQVLKEFTEEFRKRYVVEWKRVWILCFTRI